MALHDRALTVVVLVALLAGWAGAAHAANLKVTSFPSGAEVYVDGIFVGTTPATVNVTEGDHLVTVQISGSEWQPATTTVSVGPGSNDLSVTLLPEADITSVIAGEGLLGGGTEGDVTLSLDQEALDAVAEVVNNTFLVVESAPSGDEVNFVGSIVVVSSDSQPGLAGATTGSGAGVLGQVLANTTAAPYRGMEEILNPMLAVYPWGSGLGLNVLPAQGGGGIAGEFLNETGGQIMSGKVGTYPGVEVWAVQGDGSIETSGNIYMDGALFIHNNGGGYNTAVGEDALAANTTGIRNTAVGWHALNASADLTLNNTAVGYAALENLDGYAVRNNTAVGAKALRSSISGVGNTAVGNNALLNSTTASGNVAVGNRALETATIGYGNTGIGQFALFYTVDGDSNVAVGGSALTNNTNGSRSTAVGQSALYYATGSDNVALGWGAGRNVTTGTWNVHIANQGQATDDNTIRIGENQSATYISGIYGVDLPGALSVVIDSNGRLGTGAAAPSFEGTNTALGINALSSGTTGSGSTAIGYGALQSELGNYYYGSGNTAVGFYAMASGTTSYHNVAVGYNALTSDTNGGENVAVGYSALRDQYSATRNTAVGNAAMQNNYTGGSNTAVGSHALLQNTTGSQNTVVGVWAMASNTDGGDNSAIGGDALRANTSGNQNVAIGRFALSYNTTGSNNTAVGNSALGESTGGGNSAFGNNALANQTSGNDNIALGSGAGSSLQSGSYNIFLGSYGETYDSYTIRIGNPGIQQKAYIAGAYGVDLPGGQIVVMNQYGQLGTSPGGIVASYGNTGVGSGTLGATTGGNNSGFGEAVLASNTVGASNTVMGWHAMFYNQSGSGNTVSGYSALANSKYGSDNVAIGMHALSGIYNGPADRNIAVGTGAGSYLQSGNDNIFIGSLGAANESYTIRIGDRYTHQKAYIAGIDGVTVGGAAVEIDGNGQLGTTVSSRRFKEDITEMAEASVGLWSLRPVTFHYKKEVLGDRQPTLEFGLIAEEVAEIFPNLVIYDQEGRPKSVRYRLLSSLLLNELQKQHDLLGRQRETLAVQEDELEQVKHRLELLERLSATQTSSTSPQPPTAAPRAGAP